MKKLGLLLLTAVLTLLTPICMVKADNWVEVARFEGGTGSLSVSEEHFTCDYNEWRIKWEFGLSNFHTIMPQQYTLTVVTYREGEDTHLVAPRIYEIGNGSRSGTSTVHDSYGQYYMLIRAGYIDSYTITIEQNTDYTQEPTPTPTPTPTDVPTSTPTPTPPPSPILIAAASATAIILISTILLLYFKKHKR